MRRPVLATALLVAACARPTAGPTVPTWQLVEDLRIGGADTGATSLTAVAGLATDAAGKIWVLERTAKEIRVFDRTGRWMKTIGRPGSGPGEFGEVNGLRIGPTEIVWVSDYGQKRFTAFDTAGKVLGVHADAVQLGAFHWRGGLDTAGRVFDRFLVIVDTTMRNNIRLFHDSSLTAADTIPVPECRSLPNATLAIPVHNGTTFFDAPFAPQAFYDISPRLTIWCTDGASPHAVGVGLRTKDTIGVIDFIRARLPVTSAERDSSIARLTRVTAGMGAPPPDFSKIPDHKPAIIGLFVDPEERVWLQVPEPAGTRYEIFDRAGHQLAEAFTPVKLTPNGPVEVRGDTLLAVTPGVDDVPLVVRLHLVRGAP